MFRHHATLIDAFAPASWMAGRGCALALATACFALAACEDAPTSPALSVEPSMAVTPFPEGRIVYVRGGDIWVMDSDRWGSNKQNLTNTPEVEADPALSPDGRRVAYAREGAIWTMWVNGMYQTQVYANGSGTATQPAWKPDGSRIGFTFRTPGTPGNSDIYEIDPDGSNFGLVASDQTADEHSVTYHPGTYDPGYVSDGELVGFGGSGIYGAGPVWSPDGTMYAFYKNQPSQHDNFQVYVAGTGVWQRLSGNGYDETHPTWSPDGSKIAFVRDLDPAPGVGNVDGEIWWAEAYAWRTIGSLAGDGKEPSSTAPSWGNCGTVRFMPC